jgi:hypothetical protein
MFKPSWRQMGSFVVALACATGALVAAGLAEDERVPDARATHAFPTR